ncbi:MAG: hypothetical protein E6J71_09300 [Deltaproteobacteria bacterium]|nr:MAG: hypothetical protein E6J71_09300 [Deltaproteobacteria bacterium]
MNGYQRMIALLVAPLLLGAAAARAADQLVPGTKLLLKSANGREVLSFKSTGPFTPPTPGSGDDPSNVGASLQILNPGTSESFTFNLPQAHWSVSGTTFRYVDSALVEAGKVKIAIIGRILKVSGKKIGITLNEPTQGTLDAVFTTGSIRYCASFGDGFVKRDEPGRFIAGKAPAPGSCPGAPPPTTTTSVPGTTTTTSTGTTTTSTAPTGGCNCCCFSQLSFTTGLPQIGTGGCANTGGTNVGSVTDDSGAALCNLAAGGLYFGGSGVGVPLPAEIPDMGQSIVNITACDTPTGALTLGAATDTDSGSNRNCTAAGVNNPEYPGKPGCLFGPPLPIPNTNSAATSTCVVNRVSTNASGSGNCGDGSSAINIPLLSDIYLTGPTDGLIPCPRCDTNPGPGFTCQAGPNSGQPCTPGNSASLGSSYPTSHDCPPTSAAFIGSLPIPFALSTATQSMTAADLSAQPFVFCGFCGQQFSPSFQGPPAVPCTSDSQCTVAPNTKCRQRNSGAFGQGPARTITSSGSPAGVCIDDGATHASTLVSVFCIPPTFNPTVDGAGDLPGPGAVGLPGESQIVSPIPACTTSTTIAGGTTSTSLASTTSTAVATTTSTSLLPACGSAPFPVCAGTCPGTQVCTPLTLTCACM